MFQFWASFGNLGLTLNRESSQQITTLVTMVDQNKHQHTSLSYYKQSIICPQYRTLIRRKGYLFKTQNHQAMQVRCGILYKKLERKLHNISFLFFLPLCMHVHMNLFIFKFSLNKSLNVGKSCSIMACRQENP